MPWPFARFFGSDSHSTPGQLHRMLLAFSAILFCRGKVKLDIQREMFSLKIHVSGGQPNRDCRIQIEATEAFDEETLRGG